MKTRKRFGSLLAVSLLAVGSAAVAAEQQQKSSLSGKDKRFVIKAAQSGRAEVETSKLAMSKSQNDEVRKFAGRMVDDHAKANEQLAQIARNNGIEVPTTPDPAHQKIVQRLQGLQGAEFDKMYAQEAGAKDHQAAVNLFQSEAKSGRDAELKKFAGQTLPTLQEHRQMAQALVRSVSGNDQQSAAVQNQKQTTTGPTPQAPAVPANNRKSSG